MPIHSFRLSRFVFPRPQPASKTDFRIRVDFRYRSAGSVDTNTVIMPGTETHWDGTGEVEKNGEGSLREINLSNVSDWDTTFRIAADEFYEARVVVYDVKTPGVWARILKVAGKAAGAIPLAGKAIAAVIENFVASNEDVERLAEYPLEQKRLEEEGNSRETWQSVGGGGFYIQLDYNASGA